MGVPKTIDGLLAFHAYKEYGDGTSRLYLFDFGTNALSCPSDSWTTVRDPMNAHFSPDGKSLVFMGVGNKTGQWDCFLHELGSEQEPANLTESFGGRNEDPKWHPCGNKIVFKHNRTQLVETDESGCTFTVLADGSFEEIGMPFYTADGRQLLFSAKAADGSSSIEILSLGTGEQRVLYAGCFAYYPIAEGADSFVFAGKEHADGHDKIYRGFVDGRPALPFGFNRENADTSDTFPLGNGLYAVSSTRGTQDGVYRLFFADAHDGKVVPLSEINFHFSGKTNELGSCFWRSSPCCAGQ